MRLLVVGHSSHLAAAFIRVARAAGHEVLSTSSRPQAGADFCVDLTDEASVLRFKPPAALLLDGVLFCQGINPSKGLGEATYEHFQRMQAVNIAGPAVMLRGLLPHLRPGAASVFLGSSAVRRGSYDPAYGSCKAALSGLINSLARYHPQHRFNLISLALVEGSPVSQGMPEERRAQHAVTMFGNRLVDADGVARLALEIFANQNINRAEYPLDGGMSAQA